MTPEKIAEFERTVQQHLGSSYRSYLKDEGRTDLVAVVRDSTKPVFGLIDNPLGLTASGMSFSHDDEGRPTGIQIGYEQDGEHKAYVASPDRSDPPRGLLKSMDRLQLSRFAGDVLSSTRHEGFLRAEAHSLRLSSGHNAHHWSNPPIKVDVLEIDMPGGRCKLGTVNMTEEEIDTVGSALGRLDERPDVVRQTEDEMWANFEKSRRRDA